MDPQIASIIKMAMVTGSFITAFALMAWSRRRRSSASSKSIDLLQVRLERMEQAIDTIAIEMERVSEGQRFTAKLLAERGVEAPKASGRVITPH
jgi:hypothetical protein